MRVNMLGRDIEITRQTMLSDGYCLSTVKHAERISAAGDYVVSNPSEDTPGVLWLKEHVRYCRQCWCANAYKNYLVEYLEQQHPSMITAYHQGRLSPTILGNALRSIHKARPKFVDEMMKIVTYNAMPPNAQAALDFRVFSQALGSSGEAILKGTQIVRVEIEVLFDAWNLLGSAPEYDKDRLLSDWESGRIVPPFPSTYFYLSEGVNDHLIKHFLDNVPGDLFGSSNAHGFLAINHGEKPLLFERSYCLDPNGEVANGFARPSQEQIESRSFFWIVLVRAIQDEVFVADKVMVPARGLRPNPWVKVVSTPADLSQVVPFYAVRANPKKSFRDSTRGYGHRQIDWSHRWSVTGHWRHYKDGRKIWIGSHVKGPEDKPLIPSVRVYAKDGPGAAGSPGWLRRVWRLLVGLWPGS